MKEKHSRFYSILVAAISLVLLLSASLRAQEAASFPKEQLSQILAPIALYPDSLLVQILMASTYPLEVVQADQWMKANPDLTGSSLESELKGKSWDPSVKALTQFPSVLDMMGKNVEWTAQLGDAFLAQQKDVMDTVQELRSKAYAEGNLKTTPQQTVVVEKETIVIQSPQPDVVYVPAYNPTVVYGGWYYPAYPPVVVGPPPGTGIVAFGIGVAVGAAIADDWHWHSYHCDWHGGDINIDIDEVNFNRERNINRETNISRQANVNRSASANKATWQHNPEHRRGAAYRDTATSQRYGQSQARATQPGSQARGYSQQSGLGSSQLGSRTGSQSGATRAQTTGSTAFQGKEGPSRTPGQSAQFGSSGFSQNRDSSAFGRISTGSSDRLASQRGQSSRSGSGFSSSGRGGSFGGGASRGGGGRR